MKNRKEYYKEYNQRPEVKKRVREYQQSPKYKARKKEYNQRSKVKARREANQQTEKSKKRRKEYTKKYYQREDNKITRQDLNYKKNQKEYMRKYRKQKENRIKINNYNRKYHEKRMKSDLQYIIKILIRRRLKEALTPFSKTEKIEQTCKYGINYKKIVEYLQPFPKNRENYHLDHIIPLSWFDFNNPQEIKWAFTPENHQWLTKEENLKKGNRYIMIANS